MTASARKYDGYGIAYLSGTIISLLLAWLTPFYRITTGSGPVFNFSLTGSIAKVGDAKELAAQLEEVLGSGNYTNAVAGIVGLVQGLLGVTTVLLVAAISVFIAVSHARRRWFISLVFTGLTLVIHTGIIAFLMAQSDGVTGVAPTATCSAFLVLLVVAVVCGVLSLRHVPRERATADVPDHWDQR